MDRNIFPGYVWHDTHLSSRQIMYQFMITFAVQSKFSHSSQSLTIFFANKASSSSLISGSRSVSWWVSWHSVPQIVIIRWSNKRFLSFCPSVCNYCEFHLSKVTTVASKTGISCQNKNHRSNGCQNWPPSKWVKAIISKPHCRKPLIWYHSFRYKFCSYIKVKVKVVFI